MPEYKDETLCSGTKYCTWSLCAHRFGYFWGSPLFCTRCSKLRLTGRNGVTICTQLYIGFSRYEHNTGTILCWFPGTASRATSVHSPLVKCRRIFLPTLCAYQTDWYFRPHLASKSKVQTKSSIFELLEKPSHNTLSPWCNVSLQWQSFYLPLIEMSVHSVFTPSEVTLINMWLLVSKDTEPDSTNKGYEI